MKLLGHSQLCHLVAIWPQAHYFTCPLQFLYVKMEIILPHRVAVELREIVNVKCLEKDLDYRRITFVVAAIMDTVLLYN